MCDSFLCEAPAKAEEAVMPQSEISALIASVRSDLARLLAEGKPVGDAAKLIADLEQEQDRRNRFDAAIGNRIEARRPSEERSAASLDFLQRPLPEGLDERANTPRDYRAPDSAEAARGVVVVYKIANPTFYRAVFDRLAPGQRIRMETRHGALELSREEFESASPSIAKSRSYRHGSDSAPGAARYVVGRVPASLSRFVMA
jgi:hypothetical protein